MKVRLSCKHCLTGAELDEDSDPSVDLAAFCLLWMRGKACRCAGFSLDAVPPTPPTGPALAASLERAAKLSVLRVVPPLPVTP